MILPRIDSLSTRITISPIALGLMIASDDQKRFERFILLAPPSLVVLLERTSMSFCLTRRRGCITSDLLSPIELHILIIS